MFIQSFKIFLGCLVVGLLAVVNPAASAKLVGPRRVLASNRIFNGPEISIEYVPFIVQLRNDDFTMCAGILISLQHVLTAAHCVDQKGDLEGTVVVAGTNLRSEKGEQRKILRIDIHPNRNKDTKAFDVAVIKLNKPFVKGTKIQVQTKFCSAIPAVGEFLKVAGWGATKSVRNPNQLVEEDYSKTLRLARLPIISNDVCKEKLQHIGNKLNDQMICTYSDTSAHCFGDSGGPAMYEDKLCAVVSFGNGCAYGGYPGVYTSIPAVKDFIDKMLKV